MSDRLPALLSLLPALAAAFLGLGVLSGKLDGEASETFTARLATAAVGASLLIGVALLIGDFPVYTHWGDWLHSGVYRIGVEFVTDTLSLRLAVLFALLCVSVMRYSRNYMHRETGYHRFYAVLCLFSAAMQLLVTAGNGVLLLAGWELAGVSSYLLIGYFYDKPNAAYNACRAFVTNRVGDAGLVVGSIMAFSWLGGIDWQTLNDSATSASGVQRIALCLAFTLAAAVKSAQLPATPWLHRAMEGPTPSSAVFYGAVMVHAGIYLLLRLEPLFNATPLATDLLLCLGLITAVYGYLTGLVQTDVKSALICSTSAQLGLIFAECGLGLWEPAFWHMVAHAVVRAYQFLSAPSAMHDTLGLPIRQAPPWLCEQRRWYGMALQRFGVEALTDGLVVKPCLRLSKDLQRFEERVPNRLFGLPQPALRALSSLAQWEERFLGAYDPRNDNAVARSSGLLGHALRRLADLTHHVETRWILEVLGEGLVRQGRRIGPGLNRLDEILTRPRYALPLIVATLLAVW